MLVIPNSRGYFSLVRVASERLQLKPTLMLCAKTMYSAVSVSKGSGDEGLLRVVVVENYFFHFFD